MASITTRTARQPTKSRVMARRTGTPTPGSAVIIRTVMFATDPTAKGQLTLPGSRTSLKKISYADFLAAVASGRKNVNTASDNVMPAFGTNPNVMCYLDDIFIYLRARANDAVPRGRPAKHEDKPKAVGDAENRCLGGK